MTLFCFYYIFNIFVVQDVKVMMKSFMHLEDRLILENEDDGGPPAKKPDSGKTKDDKEFWTRWDAYTHHDVGFTMVTVFPRDGEPQEEIDPEVEERLVSEYDFAPDSGMLVTVRPLQETQQLLTRLGIRIAHHFQ